MLFQKSLLRELRSTAGGVLAVLLTTLVTMTLIRALGRAASGRMDGELVVPLIVFNTVSLMTTVLTLTVYISVLMVLSRWWRDSEMVIWLSSGKSLLSFVKPIWRFIWPMMVLVAVLSLVVTPWAQQQILAFEDDIQNRTDAQRASPGQFRESASGRRVFFLENPEDESGRLGAVFIRSQEQGDRRVILASATGSFEQDVTGQQWVVLERGYRTDMTGDQLATRVMGFDRYRIRLDQSAHPITPRESVRALPSAELIERAQPGAKGELALRLGLPLLTLALGVLAIPLAVVSARSGRAMNLVLALLIYITASNLFGTVKSAISQARIGFAVGWWLVPAVLLLIAAFMIWWRVHQYPNPLGWAWTRLRSAVTKPSAAIGR